MGLKKMPGLTLSKNHHTPSPALSCGGVRCPSVPLLQRKDGYWGDGDVLASPSTSCLFLPPCGPMQAWGGQGP